MVLQLELWKWLLRVAVEEIPVPRFGRRGLSHMLRYFGQFICLETRPIHNCIQKLRLFGIDRNGRFQYPEEFEQFGRKLAGPAFRPNIVQR